MNRLADILCHYCRGGGQFADAKYCDGETFIAEEDGEYVCIKCHGTRLAVVPFRDLGIE